MSERLDGKPKKKGGWRLAKYALVLDLKKTEEEREADAYEGERIEAFKAAKDKRTLRRM